ncbi:glycerate kinase [Sanguibacter sp. 25GB23B1]|uniref:glycerate kinase n=1 Tax=unclassified Sanguibacter TaxID=2645534 RepID=UPI0032AE8B9E
MHVLIAPDTFGPELGARAAGAALAEGWSQGAPHDTVEVCALSDGGHGFAALVADAVGVPPAQDDVLVVPGTRGTSTTYIDSCRYIDGVRSSVHLAEGIEHALRAGASRIVVGLPGPHELSGGPDAGAGLLTVLGALSRRDADRATTDRLGAVTAADLGGLAAVRARLRGIDLVGAAASDVPLLGLHGASASAASAGVLGAEQAHDLERAIGHFAHVLRDVLADAADVRRPLELVGSPSSGARAGAARALTGAPGTGAGGGLGLAICALGGRLVGGATLFSDVARTSERAGRADLVLTARGELDGSSFHGSALAVAVGAAAEWGVPCIAVARTSVMSRRERASVGLSALADLRAPGVPAADGPPTTVAELRSTAERLARTWSPSRVLRRT